MKTYNTADITAQEVYKLLTGSITPRPIAWITTQNADGVVNAAPFSFFNIVSREPALLSVSFSDAKDTLNNLLENGEAVVHLVDPSNVELMNQTAAGLAANISETDQFDIALEPSQIVTVPSIVNSKARFETRLYKHLEIGEKAHMVLLEVLNLTFAEEIINQEKMYIDVKKLNPVARLAGNDYGTLGDFFTIERPE
jgi:flavin reductase (DIM6/NTAB) family NADH-FMN oxidoreductase RutF